MKPTTTLKEQLLATIYLLLFIAAICIFPPLLLAFYLLSEGKIWSPEKESGES